MYRFILPFLFIFFLSCGGVLSRLIFVPRPSDCIVPEQKVNEPLLEQIRTTFKNHDYIALTQNEAIHLEEIFVIYNNNPEQNSEWYEILDCIQANN